MGILVHVLLTAVAVWVATLIPGIDLEAGASTPAKIGTLIGVLFLIIVLASPGGLIGIWDQLKTKIKTPRRPAPAPTPVPQTTE